MQQLWGYDYGMPDDDLPLNRDCNALSKQPQDGFLPCRADSPMLTSNDKDDWYYAKSVPVIFPDDLSPLPDSIIHNGMNTLYFHYFVNYTSLQLVTNDCLSNPFRTILPHLALQDANFMGLILAFAACHRACLLKHPEPINRIAQWVQCLFPTFRQALSGDSPISDTVFGMCVMLASFTQAFPHAFDAPVSWPQHLGMARGMCRSVAGRTDRPRSMSSIFFLRWFGYLDTFGSCSGIAYQGSHEVWSRPLFDAVVADPLSKCLAGHTTQSLVLLSRAAELAKLADQERNATGRLSTLVAASSQQLRCKLELRTLEVPYERYDCTCTSSNQSTQIIRAINCALCYTALVFLHRQVHLLPSYAPLVKNSVKGILTSLDSYQSNLDIPDIILPLFVAGCEVQDSQQRQQVLSRLQRIGDAGMSQVRRVRSLLFEIWGSEQPWFKTQHLILLG